MEKSYLERSLEDKLFAKVFAQESLIEQVRESIYEFMHDSLINNRELAKRLGVSPARVSKILDHSNLTLKSIAEISFGLGLKPAFKFQPITTVSDFKTAAPVPKRHVVSLVHIKPETVFDLKIASSSELEWKKVS